VKSPFADIQPDESSIYCAQIAKMLMPIVTDAARTVPIVLFVEDYHWADTHSRQFLSYFLNQIRQSQDSLMMLIVVTCRGQRPKEKETDDFDTPISLRPLDYDSSTELVQHLIGRDNVNLDKQKAKEIAEQAEGVPDVLYELYELALNRESRVTWFKKVMCESENNEFGGTPAESHDIAVKAAVLGDSFTHQNLLAVIQHDLHGSGLDHKLDQHIDYLIDRGLIRLEGLPSQRTYRFTHRHIRDCFLACMSPGDLEKQHLIAAEIIEKDNSIPKLERAELLSCCYANAGSKVSHKAVGWLLRTAKDALHHSDHTRAITKLQQALHLVTRPNTADQERNRKHRVELYLELARVYASIYGPNSEKVQKAYSKAERYVKQTKDPILDFRTQWGMWQVSVIQGELTRAKNRAETLLRHPASKKSASCRLEAHHAMWVTLFHLGDMHTTIAYHFDGMAIMTTASLGKKQYDFSMFTGYHAPQICCLARAAPAQWLSGFVDQALDASSGAVDLAKKHDCTNSLAHACAFASLTHLLCRQYAKALSHAEEVLSIAGENRLCLWRHMANILSCISKARLEPSKADITQIESSIDKWTQNNLSLFETFWRAQLSEICLAVNDVRRGLMHIEKAFSTMKRTGEKFYLSELHRVKGELLLAMPGRAFGNARRHLILAVDKAHESDSRSLELKALLSLNKHLQKGRRKAPNNFNPISKLRDAYDWFMQGLDSQDLLEAKEFLGSLK